LERQVPEEMKPKTIDIKYLKWYNKYL
jgi:hypothetical protein